MSVATTRSGLVFLTEDGNLVLSGRFLAMANPLFTSRRARTSKQTMMLQVDFNRQKLPSFVFVDGYGQCCMMIAEDGSLWAMGDLRNGVAGYDSMTYNAAPATVVDPELTLVYAREPVRVPTNVFGNVKIKELALGGGHTLALDACGRVFASGLNRYGQCGVGEEDLVETFTPVRYGTHVLGERDEVGCLKYRPVEVAPVVVKVNAGPTHSMILSRNADGLLSVWRTGNGFNGRIATHGYDLTVFTKMEEAVFFGNRNVIDVECGFSHTGFIVQTFSGKQGIMMCGDNSHGQLGVGTKQSKYLPVLINSGNFDHQNVVKVACGRYISLAVVETDKGFHKLYGWGVQAQASLATWGCDAKLWPEVIHASRTTCCDVHVSRVKCGYSTSIVLFSDGKTEVFGEKHILSGLDYAVYDDWSLMRTLIWPYDDNKTLALMMAFHVRLGAGASIKLLLVELVRNICSDLWVRVKT